MEFNFCFFVEKTILALKPPASQQTQHLVAFALEGAGFLNR